MSSFNGVVRSTRRSASACSAAYMPASADASCVASRLGSLVFPDPFEDPFAGRMRAMTAAAANLGEMLLATSRGVAPAGNSLMEPSGS